MYEVDLRVETDLRNEKLGLKIREAQLQKIPYMLIVGDKEVAARTLSVRQLNGTETKDVPLEEFVDRLEKEGRMPRTVKNNIRTGGFNYPETTES